MTEECSNCHYLRKIWTHKSECHRRAPIPVDAYRFYIGELLRDLAWCVHVMSNVEAPSKYDDINKEATEAVDYAMWPEVELDDWCGEWKLSTREPATAAEPEAS
jgi:hypothetical protein